MKSILKNKSTKENGWGYLFVLPWDLHYVGGVNQVVANLINEMHNTPGVEPYLMVNDWKFPRPEFKEVNGIKKLYYGLRRPWDSSRPLHCLMGYLFFLPITLWRMRHIIEVNKIHCINIHYPILSAINWILLKKLGLYKGKVILSLHGTEFRTSSRTRGVERKLWSFLYRHADYIVPCSNGLSNEVLAKHNLPKTKFITIYNGVKSDNLREKECEQETYLEAFMKGPYIINIGTYDHVKGQDILLKAFRKLADRDLHVKLVLVGRSGEKSDEIRSMIHSLLLADRVVMLENVPHGKTLKILRGALYFVLSSRTESFSVVLLEAGALKKAVIATDVCGVGELIDHGRSGYIVPSENIQKLYEAMLKLLDSPAQVKKYADELNKVVLANFTWSKACASYLALCVK